MNSIINNDNNNLGTTSDRQNPDATGQAGQNGIVTAMFNDRENAERAYNALRGRGYAENEINVMMSEEGRNQHFSDGASGAGDTELGNKAAEGTGIGSAVGGTVGAIIAAVAAIGTSIALPGIGLVIAGPIAAALMGAGAGGITGGLVGALIGSGIPEDRAKEYESGIQAGGIVIGVQPRTAEDASFVESTFRDAHGESIHR